MSVIADISIPAEQFALGALLEVRPNIQVRLESMIPTSGSVVPYFWVQSSDADAIEAALGDSDVVEEVHVVDTADGETLIRVQWTEVINGLIEAISEADAAVLDGRGHGDRWSFQCGSPSTMGSRRSTAVSWTRASR